MDNKYDKSNNLIYQKKSSGLEKWYEYYKNNHLIHFKNSAGYEDWQEYDKDNNLIHFKDNSGHKYWCKYDGNNRIEITEKEYKNIEYLSRKKCSRFELMDI